MTILGLASRRGPLVALLLLTACNDPEVLVIWPQGYNGWSEYKLKVDRDLCERMAPEGRRFPHQDTIAEHCIKLNYPVSTKHDPLNWTPPCNGVNSNIIPEGYRKCAS